jgi:hypothetical protein
VKWKNQLPSPTLFCSEARLYFERGMSGAPEPGSTKQAATSTALLALIFVVEWRQTYNLLWENWRRPQSRPKLSNP